MGGIKYAKLEHREWELGDRVHPLDQCRECGWKISAPSFGVGRICSNCGEVARLEGDEDVPFPRRWVITPDGKRHPA